MKPECSDMIGLGWLFFLNGEIKPQIIDMSISSRFTLNNTLSYEINLTINKNALHSKTQLLENTTRVDKLSILK